MAVVDEDEHRAGFWARDRDVRRRCLTDRGSFRHTYNTLRPHQALDERTPRRGLPRRRTLRLACGLWRTRYLIGSS